MSSQTLRFAGVELYFDDLDRAKEFYSRILKLELADEQAGHYAKFQSGAGFVCLEKKGSETYPSRDKAVLFFDVDDLPAVIATLDSSRIVRSEPTWAVLHDPEGHNILLLQR
ncbi:MAG TPA: VOC family protein [Bryobacteraceae bacterium]|nr:VOC family protein [Bryobacteraceae bacterium]